MAHNQYDTQNLDTLKINAILGINRNSLRAAHNYEAKASLQPSTLFNVGKERRRGFKPLGLPVDTTYDLEGAIIGHDQFGVVTSQSSNLYYLSDLASAAVVQTASPYASLVGSTHIPNVGVYKNRQQFMIYDKDGNIVEPFSYGINVEMVQEAEPLRIDISGSGIGYAEGLRYFAALDEWWLYGRTGEIFYSDDDMDTWNDVSTGDTKTINELACDGANLMAVAGDNTIYYSNDHGATWTTNNPTPSVSDNPTFNSVIWDGSRWIIVGTFGFIYQSTDGSTYTQIPPDGIDAFTDIYFSNSTYYISEAGYGAEQVFRRSTTATFPTQQRIGTGRQGRIYSIASNGSTWVAVGTNEAGTDPAILVSNDGNTWVYYNQAILSDASTGWTPRQVEYSNGYFLMTGVNHIYKSTNGTNWIKVEPPALAGGSFDSITIGSDNNFYVLGVGASPDVTVIDATNTLPAGKYQVVAIPHITTKTGKLVLDLIQYEFINIEGGVINISVDADADPNHANFKVDIYIKLAQYTIVDGEVTEAEVLADQDLVYIDTLGESESLAFDDYPSAATFIIGARGAIGICAFGGNTVCSYNGYLWGRLSENEADYKFLEDNINVGDIALPLTVGFTERNYLNLFTINNFEPLGSSSSDDVTGCALSSQGLLIFCDNETFLINGDPATGLRQSLYPDAIGLDVGKQATNFSGIPLTIWQGRIYMFAEGQARNITEEMYLRTDPFVQVVCDIPTKSLICRTENNNVFRFDMDDEATWLNNPIQSASYLLQKLDTPHYVDDVSNIFTINIDNTVFLTGAYTPRITFRNLDFSNPFRRDKIISISIPIQGYALRYNESNKPRMYYQYNESGTDVENLSCPYVEGVYRNGFIHFKFPPKFKGERWALSFYLTEATNQTIIEDAWLIRTIRGEEKFY